MKNSAARLWILPAKEASVALVIRRKPHSVWHFLHWDVAADRVVSGSWRWGLFYPKGCDLSWDGSWWAYHADYGEKGSGLAPIAQLAPIVTWMSHGAWNGGGFFESADVLRYSVPKWEGSVPQIVSPNRSPFRLLRESSSNVSQVEWMRLQRDGWQSHDPRTSGGMRSWQQPSTSHPRLVMARTETRNRGIVDEFSLSDDPQLLTPEVFKATYDAAGRLLVARKGVLEKYTLEDLQRGKPSFQFDLNEIADAPTTESLKKLSREEARRHSPPSL